MIFGETGEARYAAAQARLKAEAGWHKWFAWHPVTLIDGRIAFLETVERQTVIEVPKATEGVWFHYGFDPNYRAIESKP